MSGLVATLSDNIPEWAIEKASYVNGARVTAEIALRDVYKPITEDFLALKKGKETKEALVGVNTPKDMLDLLHSKKPKGYAEAKKWEKLHGQPNCDAYAKKLNERIDAVGGKDAIATSMGKRPLSVYAKAELDLRHEEQMAKLDALAKRGYRLCWLSSHADCSPRCAPWQGKLVDIVHESPLPSKRMPYKKDGNTVYSLKSIMAETDAYGYHNTIINGFNCRHHLIPYAEGSKPPKQVPERERKRQYAISQRLRAMEREIRSLKRKALLYNEVDKKRAEALATSAKALTEEYKAYAKANGFKWHKYRLEV